MTHTRSQSLRIGTGWLVVALAALSMTLVADGVPIGWTVLVGILPALLGLAYLASGLARPGANNRPGTVHDDDADRSEN